jgi:hypothetical protein
MDETNLLSLIRPWLDTNYQITTKLATVLFCKKKNLHVKSVLFFSSTSFGFFYFCFLFQVFFLDKDFFARLGGFKERESMASLVNVGGYEVMISLWVLSEHA